MKERRDIIRLLIIEDVIIKYLLINFILLNSKLKVLTIVFSLQVSVMIIPNRSC